MIIEQWNPYLPVLTQLESNEEQKGGEKWGEPVKQ